MKLDSRLRRLERRSPAEQPVIVVRHTLAETGEPLRGRVITHHGGPTAEAIDARARLVADGFDAVPGYGGGTPWVAPNT